MVHRWSREGLAFQAALNGARRELQDAVNRRLLAVAERAMTNVAEAVEQGNLSASLYVLKGLGVFGGVFCGAGYHDEIGNPGAEVLPAVLLRTEWTAPSGVGLRVAPFAQPEPYSSVPIPTFDRMLNPLPVISTKEPLTHWRAATAIQQAPDVPGNGPYYESK